MRSLEGHNQPYHKACRLQGWVTSGQRANTEGAQPHPLAMNWIKILLSMNMPTRVRPKISHHQLLPSQRADRISKNYIAIASRMEVTSQKFNQQNIMEKILNLQITSKAENLPQGTFFVADPLSRLTLGAQRSKWLILLHSLPASPHLSCPVGPASCWVGLALLVQQVLISTATISQFSRIFSSLIWRRKDLILGFFCELSFLLVSPIPPRGTSRLPALEAAHTIPFLQLSLSRGFAGCGAFQVVLVVKNPPANAGGKRKERSVQSLDQEDPLEQEMATHSSILAQEIPWTEEPGGLQSIGSQRHN